MIQLDLFTWRPRYVVNDGPIPVKNSTAAQRKRAHIHAGNTVMAMGFINRRFGK